jgi:hypothetical protein
MCVKLKKNKIYTTLLVVFDCPTPYLNELPDDDQLLIETCRSAFKCFNEWHFKLMFYYIGVHLLAHSVY